nr:MAG TPA: hypothetical protein [Bacteriophage sp.]
MIHVCIEKELRRNYQSYLVRVTVVSQVCKIKKVVLYRR